jgi:hypothetical protein
VNEQELAAEDSAFDLARFRAVLSAEWRDFGRHLEAKPLSLEQQRRGQFLIWAAVFLPEAFDEDRLAEMATIAHHCWRRDDRTWRWHRRAALEAALYAATGDYFWAERLLGNWGSGSMLQGFYAQECTVLIAHRLPLFPAWLQLAENLVGHSSTEPELFLSQVAVADGSVSVKRERFAELLARFPDRVGSFLKPLLEDGMVPNPLLWYVLDAQRYVALKMLTAQAPAPAQLSLAGLAPPSLGDTQPPLFSDERTGTIADVLAERVFSHPPSQQYITLPKSDGA